MLEKRKIYIYKMLMILKVAKCLSEFFFLASFTGFTDIATIMKYSVLLCLLLVVVSTDGLSVNGGWHRGSVSRFRLELKVSLEMFYILHYFPKLSHLRLA